MERVGGGGEGGEEVTHRAELQAAPGLVTLGDPKLTFLTAACGWSSRLLLLAVAASFLRGVSAPYLLCAPDAERTCRDSLPLASHAATARK